MHNFKLYFFLIVIKEVVNDYLVHRNKTVSGNLNLGQTLFLEK